jgi:pyridoxamine 5'-phosphate oxidase
MLNQQVAALRKDYRLASLDESEVDRHPVKQFEKWWQDAISSELDEPNAMTLATSTREGKPSARIVLLKSFDTDGFIFFTNYESRKGKEMSNNPQVSLLFFWRELERQVRIDGTVSRTPAAVSDEYYQTRPMGSRVGAIASPQSRVIPHRSFLEEQVNIIAAKYVLEEPVRPEYWGGFIVKPTLMEFWQGRSNRLHDRVQYTLTEGGEWKIERLAP